MGRNGYLDKLERTISTYRQAERDTYTQFMCDMFQITLNDPEIMGKDVFGEDRITKVMEGVSKNYDLYHGALEKSKEADYVQERLDDHIRPILKKKKFCCFRERYPWIKLQDY